MGLFYADLDHRTRRFMVEEIEADLASNKLYLSARLTQGGQGAWSDLILDAAHRGTDDTLAAAVLAGSRLNAMESGRFGRGFKRVPANAHVSLAEGEFNRFFVRGLCRRAIEDGIERLEVYRGKEVAVPRPESSQKVGLLMVPAVVLIDVRASSGVDTALGMPQGVNSGLTLRIPQAPLVP